MGYLYCIGNPRTDWLYNTEPDAGLNGRKLRYPRGKALGGCSSINGMIYMRGQARDYDGWAQLTGDDAWAWDNCLPYFKQHEDHYKGADRRAAATAPAANGASSKQRLRWDMLDAFAQAAQQAGIPHSDDFNRGDNEGVGYFQVNQKNGWRWNTAKAFLRPDLLRPAQLRDVDRRAGRRGCVLETQRRRHASAAPASRCGPAGAGDRARPRAR